MKTLQQIGEAAKAAKRLLAVSDSAARNDALRATAAALRVDCGEILRANAQDLDVARADGMSDALLDRLMLNESRIKDICESIFALIEMPDPVGRTLSKITRPNGLEIEKVTVPIGTIAVIFEARPNVSADSAALCLKSGNVAILRGGKEAIRSNTAIVASMRRAIASSGLPADCVQLVEDTSRESANGLMTLNGYVDLLIPRGGRGLIQAIVQNASVPTIETGAGTCHIYVDKAADLEMAVNIVHNAKTSRPSVCNAVECVLVHKDIAEVFLPMMAAKLTSHNVEIRGDAASCAILPDAVAATQADWGQEYDDYILACKIVQDETEAIEHIYRYGTSHSEAIVTADAAAAARFLDNVDAAAVYVNASTRYTDGGEFGLGAEIGISTQKLHARGPLGLNELTSYKYRIQGDGQIR